MIPSLSSAYASSSSSAYASSSSSSTRRENENENEQEKKSAKKIRFAPNVAQNNNNNNNSGSGSRSSAKKRNKKDNENEKRERKRKHGKGSDGAINDDNIGIDDGNERTAEIKRKRRESSVLGDDGDGSESDENQIPRSARANNGDGEGDDHDKADNARQRQDKHSNAEGREEDSIVRYVRQLDREQADRQREKRSREAQGRSQEKIVAGSATTPEPNDTSNAEVLSPLATTSTVTTASTAEGGAISNDTCLHCRQENALVSEENARVCIFCGAINNTDEIVHEIEFYRNDPTLRGQNAIIGQQVMNHEADLGAMHLWHPGIPQSAMVGEEAQRLRSKFNKVHIAKKKNRRAIDTISSRFNLSNRHKHDITSMVDEIVKGRYTKEKWTHKVTAACVYIISRTKGLPISLLDVSDAFSLPFFKLGAHAKEICESLKIVLNNVDPATFVKRYVFLLSDTFNSKEEAEVIADNAARVARVATEEWMSIGRRATAVAAASLRIAAKAFGYQISFETLSDTCGDGERTLRNRYNEMKVILINLTAMLPWGDGTINEENFESNLQFIVQHADALHDLKRTLSQNGDANRSDTDKRDGIGPSSQSEQPQVIVLDDSDDDEDDAEEGNSSRAINLDDSDDDEVELIVNGRIPANRTPPALRNKFRKVSSIASMMSAQYGDQGDETNSEEQQQQQQQQIPRIQNQWILECVKNNLMDGPPAFIESRLKIERKKRKIAQAKLRIRRQLLKGLPAPMAHTLDNEDLDIERMLLAGYDESDIEQGYHSNDTIYANSYDESEELEERDLSAEEESRYIRTPAEVEFYSTVGARFLQREDVNPQSSSPASSSQKGKATKKFSSKTNSVL